MVALSSADDRRSSRAPFRLTDLTDCGGCAAKLGADLLAEALAGLGAEAAAAPDGALIAGLDPPDDAAVYRVSDDLAIIGTLDFFPPLVDDPRTFGEIAAANALSDVFAMGGRVLFALSIAAFPEDLPRDVMTEIFAGASAKVREAGGTLAGGHTIKRPGAEVRPRGHRRRPSRPAAAQGRRPAGRRRSLLTKRLGTGLLVSGSRQGRTSEADLAAAIDGMRTLNRAAADALVAAGIRAATDVTGFGLLGHGLEMARGVGHAVRLRGGRPADARRRPRPRRGRRRDRRRRPQPPVRGRGSLDVGAEVRARARHARPRPADERRPAGGHPAR